MKPIQITDDIIPLAQFKAQASQFLLQLHREHRPMVITQNGRAAAVLLAPQDFDHLNERERFLAAVREGLADEEAGRLIDDNELTTQLDEEFGPEA